MLKSSFQAGWVSIVQFSMGHNNYGKIWKGALCSIIFVFYAYQCLCIQWIIIPGWILSQSKHKFQIQENYFLLWTIMYVEKTPYVLCLIKGNQRYPTRNNMSSHFTHSAFRDTHLELAEKEEKEKKYTTYPNYFSFLFFTAVFFFFTLVSHQ